VFASTERSRSEADAMKDDVKTVEARAKLAA
jgi:hypothetical protein